YKCRRLHHRDHQWVARQAPGPLNRAELPIHVHGLLPMLRVETSLASDSLPLAKDIGVLVEYCVPIGRMMKATNQEALVDEAGSDSLIFCLLVRFIMVRAIDEHGRVCVVVEEVGAG